MQFSLPAENVFLDLSQRAKLRLKGADRVRFLNGQVSNDVTRATTDASIYTGVMTIKGKLCADAYIHAGDDFLLVDAEAELRESLLARLERYVISDDVQIEDVTDDLGLFHVLPSETASTDIDAPGKILGMAGGSLRAVIRSRRYHKLGWDLFFDRAAEAKVHETLHTAGIALLNDDAVESLRILTGTPAWGAELDENTMPAEAGLEERAVSFSKGCYIGQEVVSRVKSVGHVNRHLCGLRAVDASPLYPGMILSPAGVEADAKTIGRITSAAPSAGHGGAAFIALGFVRRGWETPGTVLDATLPPTADVQPVDGGGPTHESSFPSCQVEVCPLPFQS